MTSDSSIRLRVTFRGTVQGVGFRPAVHRIAGALGLNGWVINDPQGATMEIEGPADRIDEFFDRLATGLPPLARLDRVERQELPVLGERGFEVRSSTLGQRQGALVPPDAVLCADCRREMEDPDDRRYHYPFTTCTNCGPRFTLVRALPYDRERTSMGCFPFCPECEREYTDPADRRFHAEPVACPACGPRLWLAGSDGKELESVADPIATARDELLAGRIVAVKGLGGFQLAVGPTLRRLSYASANAKSALVNLSPSWCGILMRRSERSISTRPQKRFWRRRGRRSFSPRADPDRRLHGKSRRASMTSV